MTFPMSVVNAQVATDNTGALIDIPVLLTPYGVLESLRDYCLKHAHDHSVVWMRKVLHAAKLFITYTKANPHEVDSRGLFLNFAQRLYTGTHSLTTGIDPSELCWSAMDAAEARAVIGRLTGLFDWLNAEGRTEVHANPRTPAGRFDSLMNLAAYAHRRDKALLGHMWSTTPEVGTGRAVRPAQAAEVDRAASPAFPEEYFYDLLTKGFKCGRRYDYRGILITLLLNGAGLRASEPFHILMDDVMLDPLNPTMPLVLIHHPEYGAAPSSWTEARGGRRGANRTQYLQEEWGTKPRNRVLQSARAGWKGADLERVLGGSAFRCNWFPPWRGQLFLKIWYLYLEEVAELERNNPYAFVNLWRGTVGAQYKLGQFHKAHERAVQRIGLVCSRAAGTAPHGHRHAYGRRLRSAGLQPIEIRKAMHHRSLDSQRVYTEPAPAEMLEELERAYERLRASGAPSAASDLLNAFD